MQVETRPLVLTRKQARSVKMPKTRKERKRRVKDNYLTGKSRKSYTHAPSLNSSLEEAGDNAEHPEPGPGPGPSGAGVCSKCRPVLSRYTPMFTGLIHQGSELKKRKHLNPHPKRPLTVHYRDLKRQNDWIRENMFDPMGNYLYCCSCIRASLGVSRQRICRQRAVKRRQSEEPLREISKTEVEEQRVSEYVVMPASLDISFKEWWSSLEPSHMVAVRYPHERHGNAGRKSNSSKGTVMEDFLTFVDANSQPNGRSADSSGPTFYFLPKFSTLQAPLPDSPQFQERMSRSLIGEFNRAQRECGKVGCSNGSCHNWLKKHRPKHSVCPHKADYCDTCSRKKAEIKGKQTTLNRLQQAAASLPEELQRLVDEIAAIQQSLANHRKESEESHQYYVDMTKKCNEKWKRVVELEEKADLTANESEELAVLHHSFNLVIAADYQMSKLAPYWGLSPQPGSTYFLQKLSHDIFGVVNHATEKATVYLFDERVGPKNTDHTVSYLSHFISELPQWVRRVHLFLDNTCATNKNWYMMAWALEMLQHGRLDFLRVSFLIAGHTKFSPDLVFSKIAKSYNRSDVFNTEELKSIIALYADTVLDQGEIVCDWRTKLTKYSKLPGIRSLHDFVFAKNSLTGNIVCKTRPLCYKGSFDNATIHVLAGRDVHEVAIPDASESYSCKSKLRQLSDTKLGHLRQMSRSFIPNDRHFPFL